MAKKRTKKFDWSFWLLVIGGAIIVYLLYIQTIG